MYRTLGYIYFTFVFYICGPRKGPKGPFGVQNCEKCETNVTKCMLHLFDIFPLRLFHMYLAFLICLSNPCFEGVPNITMRALGA